MRSWALGKLLNLATKRVGHVSLQRVSFLKASEAGTVGHQKTSESGGSAFVQVDGWKDNCMFL
jgi:hypothetical protein